MVGIVWWHFHMLFHQQLRFSRVRSFRWNESIDLRQIQKSHGSPGVHGSTKACKGGLGRLSKVGHWLRMEIFSTLLDFKPSTDNICIVSTSHYQSLCVENQNRTSTSTRYDCGFWRQPLFQGVILSLRTLKAGTGAQTNWSTLVWIASE